MISSNKAFGMVPEDLLVGGAISFAIDDIKKNPWLLDYCFNYLSKDWLSQGAYGDKEKESIKKWFLETKIFVSPSTMMEDHLVFPRITIHLESSTEDIATLGDVNYDTVDEVPDNQAGELQVNPKIIVGPFSPQSYDMSTGVITVPSNISLDSVFPGQYIVDQSNKKGYQIQQILSANSFSILPQITANFTNTYIAPVESFTTVSLEGVVFRQNYSIRCFCQNEPRYIMYLSTIVRFILLRYKEILLEDRGFDRSTVSMSGPYLANNMFPNVPEGEFIFGQNITLNGYVREYWPKMISPSIQGIKLVGLEYAGGTQSPPALFTQLNTQGWWQETDPLPLAQKPPYSFTSSFTPAPPASSLLTGLLAYYSFDGSNVNDSLGTSNASATTAISFAPGFINNSMVCSGTSSTRVVIPNTLLKPTSGITVSAWVKNGSNVGIASIFSMDDVDYPNNYAGYSLGTTTGGVPSFVIGKNDHGGFTPGVNFQNAAGTTILGNGNWQHIVGTYDGSVIKIYINGVLEGQNNWAFGLQYDAQISGRMASQLTRIYGSVSDPSSSNPSPWPGSMDEVGIWSRALTQAEITTLYNGGSGKAYPF